MCIFFNLRPRLTIRSCLLEPTSRLMLVRTILADAVSRSLRQSSTASRGVVILFSALRSVLADPTHATVGA